MGKTRQELSQDALTVIAACCFGIGYMDVEPWHREAVTLTGRYRRDRGSYSLPITSRSHARDALLHLLTWLKFQEGVRK